MRNKSHDFQMNLKDLYINQTEVYLYEELKRV